MYDPRRHMRIVGVADQHGHLNAQAPECDVLAVSGDFAPLYSSAENWKQWQEYDWVKRKFLKWFLRQPAKHKIITSGNHDLCMYAPDSRPEIIKLFEDAGIIVLLDPAETVTIDGVVFGNWCYTPTINERKWAYSQPRSSPAVRLGLSVIPDNVDVLISHGPPQGFLDECSSGHVGCAALMHRMLEIGPKLTICGHIHEERGKRTEYFDLRGRARKIVNCSIVDKDYNPKGGKPQVILLDKETL